MKDAFQRLHREHSVLRLCRAVHRPSGGAGAGRPVEDRRVITYGENPQADVRLADISITRRRVEFRCACSATARARRPRRSTELDAADARPPQCAQRPGRHRGGARAGGRGRGHPQGAAGFGGVNGASPAPANGTAPPSSTTTATIRWKSPRCCKAARDSAKGQVIAVVQPHRYTRLRDLFEHFCTCFNDADAVIVAGLSGGRSADRRRRPRRAGGGPARARPPAGDPA